MQIVLLLVCWIFVRYGHGTVTYNCGTVIIDPFTVFFSTFDKDQLAKIHRPCQKEHHKNSKLAEFESDRSETSEDMAPAKSRNFTDVCMKLAPHHINVYKILRLCGAISFLVFKLSLSNLEPLLVLRRSFQRC